MLDINVLRAIKKASKINCHYRICAIGYNKNGDMIGMKTNNRSIIKRGGGHHAEHKLILRYGKSIRYIKLIRIGGKGDILPIHPCKSCQRLMDILNIRILN